MKLKLTPFRVVGLIFLATAIWCVISRLWSMGIGWIPSYFLLKLLVGWGIITAVSKVGWETRGGRKPWRPIVIHQAASILVVLAGILLIRFPFGGGYTIIQDLDGGGFSITAVDTLDYVVWIWIGKCLAILGAVLLAFFVFFDLKVLSKGRDGDK